MPAPHEFQEQRARELDALKPLADKIKRGEALSDDEARRFDETEARIRRANADEARAHRLAEIERAAPAVILSGSGDDHAGLEKRAAGELHDALKAAVTGTEQRGAIAEHTKEHERRTGRAAQGFVVPLSGLVETRANQISGVGNTGGNVVATDLRTDLMGTLLKPSPVVGAAGASIINGLVGNVDVPVVTGEPAVAWVAEQAAPSASDAAFAKRSASPKTAASLTEVSRRLLLQSATGVNELLSRMIGEGVALAIDRVSIKGGGTNEPTGILGAAGIGSVPIATNGGAITADHIADLIAILDAENVTNARTIITNSKVRKVAMKAKDGEQRYIGVPQFFHAERVLFSNTVPANLTKGTGENLSAVVYGDFSDLLLMYWSGVDILVNPYAESVASKGGVLIHAFLDMDVVVRRPKSFAAITDVVA